MAYAEARKTSSLKEKRILGGLENVVQLQELPAAFLWGKSAENGYLKHWNRVYNTIPQLWKR